MNPFNFNQNTAEIRFFKQRQMDKAYSRRRPRKNNRRNTRCRKTQFISWIENTKRGYVIKTKTIKHGR